MAGFQLSRDARQLREILAHNLRGEIDRQGLDVARLADLALISRSQLYKILRAEHAIRLDRLDRLAGCLALMPHWLLMPAVHWGTGPEQCAHPAPTDPCRKHLVRSIKRWRREDPSHRLATLSRGSGIPLGSLYRIYRGSISVSVDRVHDLAVAMEREPWRLLAPYPPKKSG